MFAERHRGVVLELVVVADIQDVAEGIAAVGEGAGDGNGSPEIRRVLAEPVASELKARLVDRVGADHIRVGSLNDLLGIAGVVALRRKREQADPIVRVVGDHVAIAQRDGVVLGGLPIEARADAGSCPRIGDSFAEWRGIEIGIENHGIDDRGVADVAPLGVEEEGSLFCDRAADIAAE